MSVTYGSSSDNATASGHPEIDMKVVCSFNLIDRSSTSAAYKIKKSLYDEIDVPKIWTRIQKALNQTNSRDRTQQTNQAPTSTSIQFSGKHLYYTDVEGKSFGFLPDTNGRGSLWTSHLYSTTPAHLLVANAGSFNPSPQSVVYGGQQYPFADIGQWVADDTESRKQQAESAARDRQYRRQMEASGYHR
ncbi:uncharacterized protein I303_101884 [Kwoniella dejecticola CBS 10117]|uniref:Uncharacterized protein n=1 Tax=Kwoniella dejecticola CBS 10117 TaxID=1296121 RepID=A0A1A6ACH0_9TREE|nr:uncharacterized protein I303_01979 [Kwoniella dejecticola CBS 10117]OBR87767.1 hypothetical protein I303_01979 [Kwoniella dejecticola CBS 10117]